MTKIIKKSLYCNKCKKYYEVPVMVSTNSYSLTRNKVLRDKAEAGTLFKNFCPVCKEEMVNKENE